MNTREFCFWLKGHLDASHGCPNTDQIRTMLSHGKTMVGSDDPAAIEFVGELNRLLAPTFGYSGPLPQESLPGLAKALDVVLGGDLPVTKTVTTRRAGSYPAVASDAEAYYNK